MKYASLLALATTLVACQNTGSVIGLGLKEPTAVAVFQGFTDKNAGLHPYVAVASSGKDEVALLDAVDSEPVLAPVLVRPLAMPTSDPHPALLASGSLGDSTDAAPLADLLTVVGAGSSRLQLIQTWASGDGAPENRVLPAFDVDLTGQVLSIVTAPVPESDGAGGWRVATGRVRVIASLVEQRLAVVEYARGADGSIAPTGPAVVQDLALGGERFEAVALARNTDDLAHLYAASPDPIPTATGLVQGVAELDVTGAPGAWTWRGLDAHAPTLLVAAARLAEKNLTAPGNTANGPNKANPELGAFQTNPDGSLKLVDRVYAWLDPAFCGATKPIACGLAVIDPVAGTIIPDPNGAAPFMTPIALPSNPLGLTVAIAPEVKPPSEEWAAPYLLISPGSGQRLTIGVMAIPSADGKVYYLDMARWAIPSDASILRSTSTRTAVTSLNTNPVAEQRVGFWYTSTTGDHLAALYATIGKAITVTPGYTPSDMFLVTYEGGIPGFSLRTGQTYASADGLALALQVPEADGAGGTRLSQVVRIYDPSLGVHVGDLLSLYTKGIAGCPQGDEEKDIPPVLETRISALLPPDAAHPGGSALLEAAPCDKNADGSEDCTVRDDFAPCAPELLKGQQTPLSIIAGPGPDDAPEVIVSSNVLGYLGRAKIVSGASARAFQLSYLMEDPGAPGTFLDEFQLAPLCPLSPWPWPDPFPAAPAAVACDDTCRARCEALSIARKARRIYNLSDACPDKTGECALAFPGHEPEAVEAFPHANGPALAFRVGILRPDGDNGNPLVRGIGSQFTTRSGITPSYRSTPSSSSGALTRPFAAAPFDRSPWKADEGYRFYVPFVDNYVLDFSPSQYSGSTKVVR